MTSDTSSLDIPSFTARSRLPWVRRPAPGPRLEAARSSPWVQDDKQDRPSQRHDRARRAILRRFLVGFIPVVALTAIAWPYIPRRYEASAVIVLRPSDTGTSDGAVSWGQILDENAIQSEIDHIASTRLADAVIAKQELLTDPEFAHGGGLIRRVGIALGLVTPKPVTEAEIRQELAERLTVSRDRRSYTVTFGYWSADPGKAADMTQALLDAYITDQVSRKRDAIEKVAAWMRADAYARGVTYDTSKQALDKLLAESGLMDTGEKVAIDNVLAILSTQAAEARSRIIEATIRVNTLHEMRAAGEIANAPEVLESPIVQRLKESLATVLSQSAVPGSEARAINDKIAAEADRIVHAAEVELAAWQRREEMLANEIASLRARLVERRRNELQMEELKAQVAFDKEAYDQAVRRMRAQMARVDGVLPDVQIVTKPYAPLRPSFPQPLLTAAASLLLATMAGALIAWRPLLEAVRRPAEAPRTDTDVGRAPVVDRDIPRPTVTPGIHEAVVPQDATRGLGRRL